MTITFSDIEKKLGVKFKDTSLLKQAFTHRSYINENKDAGLSHNERLEYLGDAVLELVVTDFLYHKYKETMEGELTAFRSAIVNTQSLSSVASTLGMNDYLLLSKGEAKDIGRARGIILADTMEAVIGAVYIDQGYTVAKTFIEKTVLGVIKIDDIVRNRLWVDAKSRFQEQAQEMTGITPSYRTLKEVGPDHNKQFTIGVFLGDRQIAAGDGLSKQEAEQKAAEEGLRIKGWE